MGMIDMGSLYYGVGSGITLECGSLHENLAVGPLEVATW